MVQMSNELTYLRVSCIPEKDMSSCSPSTYGYVMKWCALYQHVEVQKVPFIAAFQLRTDKILGAVDKHNKIIFICSPNNPSATSRSGWYIISLEEIQPERGFSISLYWFQTMTKFHHRFEEFPKTCKSCRHSQKRGVRHPTTRNGIRFQRFD